MRITTVVLLILGFVTLSNSYTYSGHQITGQAQTILALGIRGHLLKNIGKLSNSELVTALQADAELPDEKRKVKKIDVASANQIFSIFGLKDPGCDKDNNGQIQGKQLACLGKIWKYYLP